MLRIGGFRFAPRLVPSLATAVLLAALLSLGFWQLDRAEQKREVVADHTARAELPAVELVAVPEHPERLRFRELRAAGRYDAGRQLLLDNQIRDRRPGFNVLTPLLLGDGRRAVLVDRGWVPMGATRDDLPPVTVAAGPRHVRGEGYVPYGGGLRLGPAPAPEGWPRLIQYVDFGQLERLLGYALLPVVLRLAPDQPDGYLREWPVVPFPPDRHLGYAVQWFALATALTAIYLAVNTRRVEPGDERGRA